MANMALPLRAEIWKKMVKFGSRTKIGITMMAVSKGVSNSWMDFHIFGDDIVWGCTKVVCWGENNWGGRNDGLQPRRRRVCRTHQSCQPCHRRNICCGHNRQSSHRRTRQQHRPHSKFKSPARAPKPNSSATWSPMVPAQNGCAAINLEVNEEEGAIKEEKLEVDNNIEVVSCLRRGQCVLIGARSCRVGAERCTKLELLARSEQRAYGW